MNNTFNDWLTELEVFSSRFERMLDDFPEVKDIKRLKQWLEAAYEAGRNDEYDCLKDYFG